MIDQVGDKWETKDCDEAECLKGGEIETRDSGKALKNGVCAKPSRTGTSPRDRKYLRDEEHIQSQSQRSITIRRVKFNLASFGRTTMSQIMALCAELPEIRTFTPSTTTNTTTRAHVLKSWSDPRATKFPSKSE